MPKSAALLHHHYYRRPKRNKSRRDLLSTPNIMARSSLFANDQDHDESDSTMEADPLMQDDDGKEEEEEKQITAAAGLASGVLGL